MNNNQFWQNAKDKKEAKQSIKVGGNCDCGYNGIFDSHGFSLIRCPRCHNIIKITWPKGSGLDDGK